MRNHVGSAGKSLGARNARKIWRLLDKAVLMGTEAGLGDAVVEEDLAAEEAALGAEVVRLGEEARRKALQSNSYEWVGES